MNNQKKKFKFTKKKALALIGLFAVAVAVILIITVGIPKYKAFKNSGYNSKYVYDGVSLVGKWNVRDEFDDSSYRIFEFLSDGSVITTDYVYGIEAVRDVLSTYRIEDGNNLIITYNTASGAIDNLQTRFSISKDNTTLVLRDEDFLVLERYDLEYNKDTEIFGEWADVKNPTNVYDFKSNYTATATDGSNTNYLLYSTKGDKLYLFIDEYIVGVTDYTLSAKYVSELEYEIKDGVLTLDIDGEKFTFERKQ